MFMPKTLTEAIRYYGEPMNCINAVALMRWQDGSPVCPKCNATQETRNHYWLAAQKRWKCYSCRKQFSVKVGTIFEDSPLGLDTWMTALWMLCNCKNGVSSYEIGRATGIAQKSAWFVLQRLRLVLKEIKPVMMGETGTPVEMDETFIGGKPKNMHRSKRLKQRIGMNGYAEKTAVFGMLERGTRQVRASVIPNVKRETLQKKILEQVGFGSTVYTDGWPGYDDYGARSKSKWPAKHDNILWYSKDPDRYTFNFENCDRIPYMAPGLVGPEKAARGKTPTDVWWHTIVPTNGKEKTGYATQKPLGILERIVKMHSNPGDLCLDFFAGSGTLGEAAAKNGRDFMLIDSNSKAIDVMEKRLKRFLWQPIEEKEDNQRHRNSNLVLHEA